MPREEVHWFTKESLHENNTKLHAQQSCTYYSIVNVNKSNYPFLSSYEQEQTWTLTRTMAKNHKRYQSSIENIHLSAPNASSKTKHVNYENVKIKKTRSNSLLPAQKYVSSTSLYPSPKKMNSIDHQKQQHQKKNLPIEILTNDNHSKQKNESPMKKSRPFSKPMRVIHSNGEFVVRI